MIAWQTPALVYYLAPKRLAFVDVRAPDRPSVDHVWTNGTGWTLPADFLARRIARRLEGEVAEDLFIYELAFRYAISPTFNVVDRADFRAKLLALLTAAPPLPIPL